MTPPDPSSDVAASSRLLRIAPLVAFTSAGLMLSGWHWDISWHRTIGRDTVWTPPHLLVYAALIMAFVYDAALVLGFTFGPLRAAPAVTVFGFRGPSGAFVSLWGLALQGTAIVFDLWWHDSYGLDLAVFSPPHYAIMIGTVPFFLGHFLLLARHVHAGGPAEALRRRLPMIGFVALCIATQFVGLDAVYGPGAYVALPFLLSASLGAPCMFAMVDAATSWRWASAWSGALYALVLIALMQVFQLFHGTPRFGPVHHVPERFLPPAFPVLVFIPALAAALALSALPALQHAWARSLAWAAVFVAVLVVTCIAMSRLIASPLGANRLFAGDLPGSAFAPSFLPVQAVAFDARSAVVLSVAVACAAVSARVGQVMGRWVSELRR